MISPEQYDQSKEAISKLESELKQYREIIRLYEEQERAREIKKHTQTILAKYEIFWKEFYQMAYKAVLSKSVTPENFMRKYGYQDPDKLKGLLRFRFTSENDLFKFLNDTGIRMEIYNEHKIVFFPRTMISEFSQNTKMTKLDFAGLAYELTGRFPNTKYDLSSLCQVNVESIDKMSTFRFKSALELLKIVYHLKLKLVFKYKLEEVEF